MVNASPSQHLNAQVNEGSGHMLVVAVGVNSEWGKTMALVRAVLARGTAIHTHTHPPHNTHTHTHTHVARPCRCARAAATVPVRTLCESCARRGARAGARLAVPSQACAHRWLCTTRRRAVPVLLRACVQVSEAGDEETPLQEQLARVASQVGRRAGVVSRVWRT
jgi:hypothetical protein